MAVTTTVVAPAFGTSVQAITARFVENGAGTYTAQFVLPAGSTLLDIVVTAEALWTAATSAALVVGEAGAANGFIVSTDLKATDLLVGESISISGGISLAGGKSGALITAGTNTHVTKRYQDGGAGEVDYIVTATVTSVGAGTGGRTRITVLYASPQAATITQ
jgi:hypothetical protein